MEAAAAAAGSSKFHHHQQHQRSKCCLCIGLADPPEGPNDEAGCAEAAASR